MSAKVLLIANDTTQLYNLRKEVIQSILDHGYKVILVCKQEIYCEEFKNMGCELIDVKMERRGTNPLRDVNLFRQYYTIVKNEKPDIVLTYNIKPNVYGGMVCRILKIPYLVNVCGLGTAVEVPGLMQKLTCFLYKRGVKSASCVFFQNQENREFFEKKRLYNGHIRMLPGSGVNLEKFKLLPYPDDKQINFLFISRLLKEKGIDCYLEAAQAIKKKYANVCFHILGDYDDESYLKKVHDLQEKGIVIYHGQQKDMLSFQKINNCTIHPTYYPEGMSNVLLEAAACGRPIITTNRAGCREIVEDGITGFICRQKDSADLIAQIEKFLSMSREQQCCMGLAGRHKVEKEFDRQIVVNTYIEEIAKIFK